MALLTFTFFHNYTKFRIIFFNLQSINFIMIQDNPDSRFASPEEFYTNLKLILDSMLLSESNGDYIQAQSLKQKAFHYRKKWEESTLEQMDRRYNEAMLMLQESYNKDLQECSKRWTTTLDDYVTQCKAYIDRTDKDNAEEIAALRRTLAEQLPSKVKESYQLLNLREMEHHMSKQKDFTQAHLVQNKIKQLYNQQLAAWNQDKNKKIEQAVTNLRNKHGKQRDLFNKRMQIQLEDHNNGWHMEKIMLTQRYNNTSKELKANHERELGSFKKEFKTKGGLFSSKFQDTD